MKFFLLTFLALGCSAIADDELLKKWTEFQKTFEKSYKSPIESSHRLKIFKKNLEEIEKHNELYSKGEETYFKGINQFTDWTSDEFLQYVNKFQMINTRPKNYLNLTKNSMKYPAHLDWRAAGAVTGVKNQGSCGSCWSFSATGALEGQAKIKFGRSVSFSEQNLIDCAVGSYKCNGCSGGLMDGAFLYVSQYGINYEQTYPYMGRQGQCRTRSGIFRNTGYADIRPNENDLANAVTNVGPVSIGIEATANLQSYRGGIFFDRSCSNRLNHGVLIVGYGVDNGISYWIIKNSWGVQWGEQGYFRLIAFRNNCGVALSASVPTFG